jgi:hypothetical protein
MTRGIVQPVRVDVRQEATQVVVIRNGTTIFDMPWDAALQLAQAIYTQAKRAEELAKADAIAGDQAILLRLGVPLGLSDRSDIRHEAQQRAAWDSDLRRYIPLRRAKGVGGIRSAAAFGTPRIIRHQPRSE